MPAEGGDVEEVFVIRELFDEFVIPSIGLRRNISRADGFREQIGVEDSGKFGEIRLGALCCRETEKDFLGMEAGDDAQGDQGKSEKRYHRGGLLEFGWLENGF